MIDALDNPAWNALISGNSNLANGDENLKYFSPDVSPFIAFADNSNPDFQKLYDVVLRDKPIIFITHQETAIPAPWKMVRSIPCLQMIYEDAVVPEVTIDLVPLDESHIPEMIALTQLTNPGPFLSRTIDFGHYFGVFDDGKLVAMAGQRLHVFNYAEISAVCTHPDHLGKGYARQLLLHHIRRIKASGDIPMLHVRYNNDRAIKVYESTGFTTRKQICFYVIEKDFSV